MTDSNNGTRRVLQESVREAQQEKGMNRNLGKGKVAGNWWGIRATSRGDLPGRELQGVSSKPGTEKAILNPRRGKGCVIRKLRHKFEKGKRRLVFWH